MLSFLVSPLVLVFLVERDAASVEMKVLRVGGDCSSGWFSCDIVGGTPIVILVFVPYGLSDP